MQIRGFSLLIVLLALTFTLCSCKKTSTSTTTKPTDSTTTIDVIQSSLSLKDAVTEYFVGESFNKASGLVEINDNGKKSTLPLNSSRIKISELDSSTKGEKEIEIEYGSLKETIKINVYEIESINFAGDLKLEYYNYDKEISFDGIKIELVGNNGAFKKTVDIDPSELKVEGFDNSLVSKENASKKETIVISYKGVKTSIEITMNYSELSEIKSVIDELSLLSFASSDLVTDSDIEKAILAYEIYKTLDDENKERLDDLEVSYFIRGLAIDISRKWDLFLEKYKDSFKEEFDGKDYSISFLLPETIDEVKDYLRSVENDNEFNELLDFVDEIRYARTADILKYRIDSITVEKYLSRVYNKENFKNELKNLEVIIKIIDDMKDVPGVDSVDLSYEQKIVSAISDCISYYDLGYLNALSSARKYRNDLYEVFYQYYLLKENLDNENILKIEKISLPLGLEEAYYKIKTAVMMQYYFSNGQSIGESVNFMTLYLDAVSSTGDEILKDGYEKYVYRTFKFDDGSTFYDAIRSLRFGSGGYNDMTGTSYIDQNFTTLWNKYIDLYEPYFYGNSNEEGIKYLPFEDGFERTDGKEFNKEKYVKDIEEFASFYFVMPISTRLPFINSISMYSNGGQTFFTTIITEYYKTVFTKEGYDAFYYLFISEQYDISRFESAAARSNFIKYMAEALRKFDELEDTEKENIKVRTGALYENMKFMYDNTDKTTHELLPKYEISEEWQKVLDDLEMEIKRFIWLRQQNNINNDKYFGALLATYQRIYNYNYQITRSPEQAVRLAYMYLPMELNSMQKLPLSYQVLTVTQTYVSLIHREYSENLTYSEIIDGSEGFTLFLYKASFIMEYDYVKEAEISKDDFDTILKAFQDLNAYQKYLLTFVVDPVSSGMNEYYSGIAEYVYRALPSEDEDNLSTLLTYLISSEINYTQYLNLTNGEMKDNYRNIFINYFEKAIEAYNKLTSEAKEVVDTMYQYYLEIYNELKNK